MSLHPTPRPAVLGGLVSALALGGLGFAAPATAASADVVINEVYGGGGNSGATYRNDFIELRNISSAPVTVTGWSVQYASASGSSWAPTPLTGTIPAGGTYLVQEAAGTGGSTPLPTPDATGTTALSGTTGKIALVTSTAALTCGADCDHAAGVRDFLGWGTANDFETAPAPGTGTTTSVARAGGKDTDSNQADFTTGSPTPSTSGASPATPAPTTCGTGTVAIGRVQGTGPASPCAGETVTVAGTVVGDLQDGGFGGFFVQDTGDADAATSDGVFVYSATPVRPGDRVSVTGTVTEYNGLTEITRTTVTVSGSGALPPATVLPLPSSDAQREALEGMLVAPAQTLTVTDVYPLDTYGEIALASGGRLVVPTEIAEPGAAAQAVAAQNAARSILLDDGSTTNFAPRGGTRQPPPYLTVEDPVRVGDTAVLEPVVLTWAFGDWLLEPADGTPAGTTFTATNPRPAAPEAVGGDLRIADFNVLNYFVDLPDRYPSARGATTAAELAEQQAKIVTAITALDADIVTLHEIENSAVLTPDTPYRAVETLVAALNQAQGPDTWRFVRAHEASDVITNAIIYRTNAAHPVGEPVKPTEDAVWDNAREPIAQTFRSRGEVFTVIANHLKSKGSGSGPGNTDAGDGQGASNADRVAQARALVAFAASVVQAAGDPDVLLTGDFNAYRLEDPIDVITGAGYQEVFTPGQYSYVFDGGSGSLDHVFASPSMLPKVTGHTVWDINAVESYAYQYDGYEGLYAPYAYRASDHNPTLVGVDTKAGAPAAGKRP